MAKRLDAVTETRQVEILICDFCGYESNSQRTIKTCCVCGRQACRSAKHEKHCARPDPEDYSDYPDWYCPTCYELRYVKYGDEFTALDAEYEVKRGALWRRVKDEAVRTLAPTEAD